MELASTDCSLLPNMSTEMRVDPSIYNHSALRCAVDEIESTSQYTSAAPRRQVGGNSKEVTHGSVTPSLKMRRQFKTMNGMSAMPDRIRKRVRERKAHSTHEQGRKSKEARRPFERRVRTFTNAS